MPRRAAAALCAANASKTLRCGCDGLGAAFFFIKSANQRPALQPEVFHHSSAECPTCRTDLQGEVEFSINLKREAIILLLQGLFEFRLNPLQLVQL